MKARNRTNIVISVFFIALVAWLAAGTLPTTLAPMARDAAAAPETGVSKAISEIDAEWNDDIVGKGGWIDLYGATQRALGKMEAGDYDVVKDLDGFLHRAYNADKADNLDRYETNLKDLCSYVSGAGIDFLLVETPGDVIAGRTRFPAGISSASDANISLFVERAEAAGIPTLDARTLYGDLALGEIFYRTDHHWALPMTFRTFAAVVDELNARYGLRLDPDGVYTDPDNYEEKVWKNQFLGSVGIRNGRFYAGMEDFRIYVPRFATDLTLRVYVDHELRIERSGGFWEAFIDESKLAEDHYNKYQANLYDGDNENVVTNRLSGNDLRCLLISDSFGRAFTEYLSLCFAETAYLDPSNDRYTDSYAAYIEQFRPDVVIAMPSGDHIWNMVPL